MAVELPSEVLYEVFSRLTGRDLFVCSMVCKAWKRFLDEDENQEDGIWSAALEASTSLEFRNSPLISKLSSSRKLMVFENTWNKNDISRNIYIKDDQLTTHRHPIAQSTDLVRGKRGYLRGRHYWIIVWHGPNLGSNAVVGVATGQEKTQEKDYFSLLGGSCESWGWDLSNNLLQHNGQELGSYMNPKVGVQVK